MASRLRRQNHTHTRVLRTTIAKILKHDKVSLHSKRSSDNNNVSKKVLRPQQDKDRPPGVSGKKRRRHSGSTNVISSVHISDGERVPSITAIPPAKVYSLPSAHSMETSLPPVRKVERIQPLKSTSQESDEATSTITKRHEKPEKEEKRIVREDRIWMNERIWRDRLLKKRDIAPTAPEFVLMVVRNKPPRSLILK